MAKVLQRKYLVALSSQRRHQTVANYVSLLPTISTNVRSYSPKWDISGDDKFSIISSLNSVDPIHEMTIPEFLRQGLPKYEHSDAFICGLTGRKYTHGQIHKAGQSFATALLQSGLKRNDVVSIALPNLPEFPIVNLGGWDAGLISSTVNPRFTTEEFVRQLQNVKPKAIVTVPSLLSTVFEAKKQCSQLKSVIVIGDPHQDCHSFFEMMKVDSSGTEFLKGSQIDATQEVASIPFSGGISGSPKGVMLTHSNYCTNIAQILHPSVRPTEQYDGEQEILMGILPFFHSYGNTCILGATLYQGASAVVLPKFEPADFVRVIREYKPTTMHMVTTLIQFLAESSEIGVKELRSLKSIIGGRSNIGPHLINTILEKSGAHILYQEDYGMTECTAVSHILLPDTANTKVGSCGSLVPGTLVKIVNVETGEALGVHSEGELCIKGPQVMKGYLNNEKATAETIDSNSWLHTGDIGYFDEDNCFYIVDRLKELIKVKGLQVSPSELEDILRQHVGVADVAVIGVPDKKWGELPRAYIVKKETTISEDNINDYMSKKVSPHKKLKGGIQFVKAIPKNDNGKILRNELKEDYLKNVSK